MRHLTDDEDASHAGHDEPDDARDEVVLVAEAEHLAVSCCGLRPSFASLQAPGPQVQGEIIARCAIVLSCGYVACSALERARHMRKEDCFVFGT